MWIENYTIHEDLSVDINGNVHLTSHYLAYIPVQFGIVTREFWCIHNQLTDLVGSPHEVGKDFYCGDNQLTTLYGSPKSVCGDFSCDGNKITNFKNAPIYIEGSFYAQNNPIDDLTYLEFEVKKRIIFHINKDMNYLRGYRSTPNVVAIDFAKLKEIQQLKLLNEKLNNELSINQVARKNKI